MRSRMALGITAVFAVLAFALSSFLSGSFKEQTKWKSSKSHVAMSLTAYNIPNHQDQEAMLKRKAFLLDLAVAEKNALTYLATKARLNAQERAVSQTSTGSTSPVSTTTQTPTTSEADSSSIWACIIEHESGGNPSAVNSSSGAGGLYQFLVSSWLGYGGGQYAPTAEQATPAEQTAIAYRAQAVSGWWPWRGDRCTPVG